MNGDLPSDYDQKNYRISVGTADEYNDYIAEVHFPEKAGVIVSQERGPGQYDISVHSFLGSAADDFDYSRNIDAAKLPLQDLEEALKKAKDELARLQKRRT